MGAGVDQSAAREIAVRWFRELARRFDQCLEFAKQEIGNIQYFVDSSSTADDLQSLLKPKILIGVAGHSESYRDLLRELVPGQPLAEGTLARLCGFYLIPSAAHHVIDAVHVRLLTEPLALCRPLELPGSGPSLDDWLRLRVFWRETVLPALKESDPAKFPTSPDDPWTVASENAAACRLLADLVQREHQPVQGHSESRSDPVVTESDDRFPADHFRLKWGLKPDTLAKAQKDGRMKRSEKRDGRWFHSLSEVKSRYPDVFSGNELPTTADETGRNTKQE